MEIDEESEEEEEEEEEVWLSSKRVWLNQYYK